LLCVRVFCDCSVYVCFVIALCRVFCDCSVCVCFVIALCACVTFSTCVL